MKHISVSAAIIFRTAPTGERSVFATQRGYGDWRRWWEFPGGKIEQGETPQSALVREIREELATQIRVVGLIDTIEYDYPDFHLTMHCFECEIISGKLELLEHENSSWLTAETLRSVKWLPADDLILPKLEKLLPSAKFPAVVKTSPSQSAQNSDFPQSPTSASSSSTDTLTPLQRHKNMSAIHSTGGALETALRSALFRFGFRFRKNDKRLIGTPDIVFPHYHAVIFVNGCFWHAHRWKPQTEAFSDADVIIAHSSENEGDLLLSRYASFSHCSKFRFPRSNTQFWLEKFTRNRNRDLKDIKKLIGDGWRVCIVWECSISASGKKRKEKIADIASKISLWLEESPGEAFLQI
mgnify:CR=1 FL=1